MKGSTPVKKSTIRKALTSALRSSLLIAEQKIPTASEKRRLFAETNATLQNSVPVTPPANSGIAITGKIANMP